jgi:hypothetical protein
MACGTGATLTAPLADDLAARRVSPPRHRSTRRVSGRLPPVGYPAVCPGRPRTRLLRPGTGTEMSGSR